MSDTGHSDPYNEIAVRESQQFELRGSGLAVPLQFKPDAAFMLRTVLEQESEFTKDAIVEKPGFDELCDKAYPLHRFSVVFPNLRFVFDALGSTLIQTGYIRGKTTIYNRNPNYRVIDEFKLLARPE